MKEFTLSDNVWHRVIQVVQEAMIEGVDVADLLRQIRVVEDENGMSLSLSPSYKQQVVEMHEKLLKQAEEFRTRLESAENPLAS